MFFKKLFEKVKIFQERNRLERAYQRSIDLNAKRFYIKLALIRYYNDYNTMHDTVDIPAHVKAEQVMSKVIKRPSDVDRLYRKTLEMEATLWLILSQDY